MKHTLHFLPIAFIVTLLSLAACDATSKAGGTSSWALGEQPNFSGTLVDWAKGDAVAPGEGQIIAHAESPDGEEADIGWGTVKADGSFSFGLQKGAGFAGGGQPPGALCAGFTSVDLTPSNPQQKIVGVSDFEIPALYQEGRHARPAGGVKIRVQPPSAGSLLEGYSFTYANAGGTIKGSCSAEGITVSFNLDLRKGWNAIYLDASAGPKFITAAIPTGAKWYFVNPLTLAQ